MPYSAQIQFEYYRAEAEALVAAGQLHDALWSYETGLTDPRFADHRAYRLALGMALGDVQLQLLAQTADLQTARKQLDHTIALLRRCVPDLAEAQRSAFQLLLARIHCESFERFGDQRDLLGAHMLIDQVESPDQALQADIDTLRRRLAQTRRP